MGNIKRKQLVVDRTFQFRFVSTFLFSILAALLVLTLVFGAYYWISTMAGENLFREFITIDRQIYDERVVERDGVETTVKVPATETIVGVKRWEIVIPVILVNNVIIMIILSVIGLVYSHRIAGPAYRMITDIQRALEGETGVRIRLRKKDKLKELGTRVDLLIRRLDEARGPSQE